MSDRWEQARLDHRAEQARAIAAAALALILERGAPALTMAGIAEAAQVSRQTLYRYYPDVEAVLSGVAELIAAHDDSLVTAVTDLGDPAAQLDVVVGTVAGAADHHGRLSSELRSTLPPSARVVLADHESRIHQLVADVLAAGVASGQFRPDLDPPTDAPLLVALAAAARPNDLERALTLVHLVVDRPEETPS